jgi:hypothetical protein
MDPREIALDIEQVVERWRKAWEFEAFERPLPLPETINAICEELAFSLERIGCKEEEIALFEAENAKLREALKTIAEIKTKTEHKAYGTVISTPTLESIKRYASEALTAAGYGGVKSDE